MTQTDLLQLRLSNQRLTDSSCQSVSELVGWLGAVQSQDYNDAKWSLAQRLPGLTEATFEEALNAGSILRTHVLRPTWHFVAAEDLRWMLDLTARRVMAFMRTNDRKLGLDEAVFAKSNTVIERALAGGEHRTRAELGDMLRQAGIPIVGNGLIHLLMRAELEGIICSGTIRGRHQTYALLAQRVPYTRPLPREEALAELVRRYLSSHGPATDRDFSWWSGLTLTDARLGIALITAQLVSETIDGNTYWYIPSPGFGRSMTSAFMLPNFDEYIVAYADRRCLMEPDYTGPMTMQGQILNHRTIVLNGKVAGTWRIVTKKTVKAIVLELLRALTDVEQQQLDALVARYKSFYGQPVQNEKLVLH